VHRLKDYNLDRFMATEEKKRYYAEELKEFEEIIRAKLQDTNAELKYLREALSKKNDTGTDSTSGNSKVMEDGADTAEKENLNQLAVRQQKFAKNLENALMRIKNGTYGVCIDSGKLISKERLRLVPHTQHSIEAKLKQK
jgi:RNA polymerase-binding transcription factor DksA